MIVLQLIPAALGISLDTFAAALALGARTQRGDRERVAVTFAIVGGISPVIGVLMGRTARAWLEGAAGLLGAAILAGLGIWLLAQARSSWRSQPRFPEVEGSRLPNDGKGIRFRPPITGLVAISLALSPDNFLIGVGTGLHEGGSVMLGFLAAIFIYLAVHVGLHLGAMGRQRFGSWALAGGGVVLIFLAMAIAGGLV